MRSRGRCRRYTPSVAPYYLTTPIYYVNDAPHVGTAYTTVNADALARWHRLLGDDVYFMTGTDEHGAKIVEAAEAHDTSPLEWTNRTSARFVEAWKGTEANRIPDGSTPLERAMRIADMAIERGCGLGSIAPAGHCGAGRRGNRRRERGTHRRR